MTDYVSSIADYSELVTWYGTIPSTVPSGDRYIAECAAGTYNFAGVTWTGKTTSNEGAITIRPATGAKPNSPNTNPARPPESGTALFGTSFGGVNTFGASSADGFLFEDCHFNCLHNGGTFQFNTGAKVQRSVGILSGTAVGYNFNSSALSVNNIWITIASGRAAALFAGTGAHTSNTFITFINQAAVGLSGSYQNAVWKNNVALNLAASPTVDPWPSPPTSFFSGGSNNATSHASIGNCPGTSSIFAVVGSDALTDVTNSTTLNARPKSGSVLLAAGAVASSNGGIDWYGDTRNGSTPTIGAVELVPLPAPSDLSGDATLGDITASGTLSNPCELSGDATLGDITASGTLATDSGRITTLPLKNNTGTVLANESGIDVHVYALTGELVVSTSGQVSDASGVVTFLDVAIVRSQNYRIVIVLPSGAEGMARITST